MSKLFCLFAFLCAFSLSIASAQTVTYNFESPRRATGAANASFSGTLKFPNGTPASYTLTGASMSYTINYNSTEKKPVSISFVCPTSIDFDVFSTEILAMSAGEFGAGFALCVFNGSSGLELCISNLWGEATSDCAVNGGEGSGHPDCWMFN